MLGCMGRDDAEQDWDPEGPDESDVDDDDGADTEECPRCGAEIYAGAERCPSCGTYLSEEEAPRRGRRRAGWVWAGIILALAAAVTWLLR